jgi:hypothetical protein
VNHQHFERILHFPSNFGRYIILIIQNFYKGYLGFRFDEERREP